MYSRVTIIVLTLSLLFVGVAFADIPRLISYQGCLYDDLGDPAADGDYEITFSIFPDSTGMSSLWEETQSVSVAGGLFNVYLGTKEALDPMIFIKSPDLFLGIWLSDDRIEFQPRTRLVSVAYSYVALHADTADYAHTTVTQTTGWVDDGTVVHTETATDSVGIGTDSPSERLEVVGNLRLTGKATIGLVHTNSGASGFVAGYMNTVSGDRGTVSGGYLNKATAGHSVIGGGARNCARGIYSVVAGGGGPDAADSNAALGEYSAVSGGRRNSAVGDRSSVGGGYGSIAEGSHATIGGGRLHLAQGDYATIAGGIKDTVLGYCATIGGGANNYTGGDYCTVGGGGENSAWGTGYATVSGGYHNEAYGQYSMVPGGYNCMVTASYSFAAGRQAWADGTGSFVWADNNPFQFGQGAYSNRFLVRCTGGAYFVTGIDGSGNSTSGASLAAGSGTWANTCDHNLKENFVPIDSERILEKVAGLPIRTWNYIAQDDSIRHIGPVAQDVYAAFGVGPDDRHITTVDADGIALAAIQALHSINRQQQREIAELREENESIRSQLARLQDMVEKLANEE